jgi:glutaredoxin
MRPAKQALLVLLSAVAVGGVISGSQSNRALAGDAKPPIEKAVPPSSAEQLALAEHLHQIGALFYGAWWCPHCHHQKDLFGTEAGQRLPYVECDKDDRGRQRCTTAGIRAFPTWILKGDRREGVLTLEELKIWSGFGQASTKGRPQSGSTTTAVP